MPDLERRVSGLLHDATSDLRPDTTDLVRRAIRQGQERRRRTATVMSTATAALAVAALIVPFMAHHRDGGAIGPTHGLAPSPTATATEAPTHPASPTSPRTAEQIQLPLARYMSSAADEQAYFMAVNLAQKSCAAKFGVTSSIPVTRQPSQVASDTIRRYGIIDAEEVARYGYDFPPSYAASEETVGQGWDPSARELAVMTARRPDGTPVTTDSETGKKVPAGGCAAEGYRLVDKGQTPPTLNLLADDLLGQAWSQTVADPRALAAAREWSACMSGHGYHFKHRWDAAESVGGQPEKVEIRMAKLDLRCANETGYIDTWYAVDTEHQNQLIHEHRAELEVTLADQADVMARVKQALRSR